MDILVWLAMIPFEKPQYQAAAPLLTRKDKLMLIAYNAVLGGILAAAIILILLFHPSDWQLLIALLAALAIYYPRKQRKRIILSALARTTDADATRPSA